MKKLLKSFLIATASIGTIAGSTAAVVSCGENTDNPTGPTQDDYNKQVDTVVKAVGTATDPIQLAKDDSADIVKTKIAAAITTYISAHTADLPLLATTVDNTAIALDPATGPNTSGTPSLVTNSVIVTIPVNGTPAGIVATPSQPTTMNFNVVINDQEAYDDQSKQVLDNIGTVASKIIISQNDSDDQVKKHIVDAINDYITANASSLTAIKNITAADIPGATGINTSTPVAAATHNISLTIPKADGSTATANPVTKSLNYSVLSPQDIYNNLSSKIAASSPLIISAARWVADFTNPAVGDTLSYSWSTDEMNGPNKDAFKELANLLFRDYYLTASTSLKTQIDAVFGTDTHLITDINVVEDIAANTVIWKLKIQFKSTNAAPNMSSAVFTFTKGT